MTDEALRRATRTATDDPEEVARRLALRLRAGELARERLEVAALCGHRGASIAAHVAPFEGPARAFFDELARRAWSRTTRARLLVAIAAHPAGSWGARYPADPEVPRAFALLEQLADGLLVAPSLAEEQVERAHRELQARTALRGADGLRLQGWLPDSFGVPVIDGLRLAAGLVEPGAAAKRFVDAAGWAASALRWTQQAGREPDEGLRVLRLRVEGALIDEALRAP